MRSPILGIALIAVAFSLMSCDKGVNASGGDAPGTADLPQPAHPPAQSAPTNIQTPSSDRDFLPSRHGFAFVNSFTGDPLPEMLRNTAIARVARQQGAAAGLAVPTRFGLCGGMSAAAADFYRAGRRVPGKGEPPREGEALHAYLKQRNLDSLGGGLMAMKFIEWMNLPESSDGDCTIARTSEELGKIEAILRRHGLVPLGLVYVDAKSGVPWENHQVLAYRMERDAGSAVVYVYDPNFPRDDSARLEMQLKRDGTGRDVATVVQKTTSRGASSRDVRGVFAMPYAFRVPPADVD